MYQLPCKDSLGAKMIGHTSLHREVIKKLHNIEDHVCCELFGECSKMKGMLNRPSSLLDNTDPSFDIRLAFICTGKVEMRNSRLLHYSVLQRSKLAIHHHHCDSKSLLKII